MTNESIKFDAPHDSADDRTLMAEERTFGAWVRTGLTAVATGLGIVKLLPSGAPSWRVELLGVVLIAVGALSFLFAFWGYVRGAKHWSRAHRRAVPLWLVGAFTGLLLLGAGLAMSLVWLT